MVTFAVICASFMGASGIASAQGRGDRDLRLRIAQLRVEKDRAIAHHHRGRAREIQEQIDSLRARMHHHDH